MIYMTLPFENDTKTIIKRISSRNISANRKRNIFIIITIALASTLLSAITLYGFGITQKTKNLNKKNSTDCISCNFRKRGFGIIQRKRDRMDWRIFQCIFGRNKPFNRKFYLRKCRYAKISKYALFGKVTNCGR